MESLPHLAVRDAGGMRPQALPEEGKRGRCRGLVDGADQVGAADAEILSRPLRLGAGPCDVPGMTPRPGLVTPLSRRRKPPRI